MFGGLTARATAILVFFCITGGTCYGQFVDPPTPTARCVNCPSGGGSTSSGPSAADLRAQREREERRIAEERRKEAAFQAQDKKNTQDAINQAYAEIAKLSAKLYKREDTRRQEGNAAISKYEQQKADLEKSLYALEEKMKQLNFGTQPQTSPQPKVESDFKDIGTGDPAGNSGPANWGGSTGSSPDMPGYKFKPSQDRKTAESKENKIAESHPELKAYLENERKFKQKDADLEKQYNDIKVQISKSPADPQLVKQRDDIIQQGVKNKENLDKATQEKKKELVTLHVDF